MDELDEAACGGTDFATNYTHFRAQDAGRRGKQCGALFCRGEPNNEADCESDFEARRHNAATPVMRPGFQPIWQL
jgi:hypothetical protein